MRKTVPVYQPKTQQTNYQRPFTKNEYLQQLLRVAQQQVAYRYLLADSWYASAENMTLVRALGHHFLFALESSRTAALRGPERGPERGRAGPRPIPTGAVAGVSRCAARARLVAVRARGGARQ